MASIGVRELGRAMGTLLIGPVFPSELNETAVSHILAPLEISVAQKSALIAYYRSIPVLDCRALIDGAILAYNQMYGEHIMLSQLMDQKRLLPEAPLERARPFLDDGRLACLLPGPKASAAGNRYGLRMQL